MERGLYAAATGMMAQQAMQDTLAYNMANVNTSGFKQESSTFRAMQGLMISRLQNGAGNGPQIGELGMGVQQDQVYTDWQTGALEMTQNPLDASLGTNQFFAVQTNNGERYTRAGSFMLDATGMLVTSAGLPVLGQDNQPIRLPANLVGRIKPALDNYGNLTNDGKPIAGANGQLARIKVVTANVAGLAKEGDTLFRPTDPNAVRLEPRPTLRIGTVEQANVNAVSGMVRLITISRGFEMAQRALTTQDELLRQAASEVGKV